MSVEAIIERGIAFAGTPEQVTEQIARIKAVPGIGELCVIANFGGIAHWKAMKTMELLAERVMPALRQPAKRLPAPDSPHGQSRTSS